MASLISNSTPAPSPFRFDTSPSGEADVDPDQIAVLDGPAPSADGWGSDGFGFRDVLDIINPLQHIPVVSSIYRAVTGDEIASAPRAIGGAIYGGPIGLLAAVSNSIVEAETGSDIGETAIAALGGSQDDGSARLASSATMVQAPLPSIQVAQSQINQSQADQGSVIRGSVTQGPITQGPITQVPVNPNTASYNPLNSGRQRATVSSSAIQTPARETLMEQLAKKPPAKVGGYIPSDAAARAGLFGFPQRAAPVSTAPAGALEAAPLANREQTLQSAPANALDRLIARSRAAQAERAGNTPEQTLQVPTDSNDVHGWMLRALGKYETMPKG